MAYNIGTTAVTKVYDLLEGGTTSPAFSNVYNKHNIVDMTLPAVTVGLQSIRAREEDGALESTELIDNEQIIITVRVHTNYIIDYYDESTAITYIGNMIEALKENRDLGNGYRLIEVTGEYFDEEFSDTGTRGAEVVAVIHKVVSYSQS